MSSGAKTPDPAPALPPLRAPVLIGVTGHRNLHPEQQSALQQQVRQTLEELQAKLPDTPFVLLSALAEGADQLVAEVALELGWPLLAPLPMERQRYAHTFDSKKAAARMLALLDSGVRSEVLGTPEDDDVTAYQRLEAYLARHAHILLALWDGEPARGGGGTACVVQTARTSRIQMAKPRTDRARQEEVQRTPSIPVLWFPTRRQGEDPPRDLLDGVGLLPAVEGNKDLNDADIVAGRGKAIASLVTNLRVLSEWNRHLSPLEAQVASGAKHSSWTSRFEVIDQQAIRLQKVTRRWFALRLWMLVAGFLGLEMAVGPLAGNGWVCLAGVVLLALGTLGLAPWNQALDRRYLEARTMAEHLRIRRFLSGGQTQGPPLDSTYHLRLVSRPGDMLCHGLDAWEVFERLTPKTELGELPSAQTVLEEWVDDQVAYFRAASVREELAERRSARRAGWLMLVGLLLSGLLAASFFSAWEESLRVLQVPMMVAATALLLTAAAIRAMRAYRAFGPLANRYALAQVRFESASESVRRALEEGDQEEAWWNLHALADKAFRENSEWFALNLERPPDAEI